MVRKTNLTDGVIIAETNPDARMQNPRLAPGILMTTKMSISLNRQTTRRGRALRFEALSVRPS